MISIDNTFIEKLIKKYSEYSVDFSIHQSFNIRGYSKYPIYQSFVLIDDKKFFINVNNTDCPSLYISGDGGYLPIIKEIGPELKLRVYKELTRIYDRSEYLKRKLSFIPKEDLLDRLEEFEVIKDNQIDMISLNNLYDFYNKKFIYN